MREIKFRGRKICKNEWVYGYYIEDGLNNHYIVEIKDNKDKNYYYGKTYRYVEVIPETIGQFTGLYDKNDVEIYEGDLLKVYFDINEIDDYLFFSLNDEERESGWFIKEVTIPEFYAEPINDDFEVIGNIFDNKENI